MKRKAENQLAKQSKKKAATKASLSVDDVKARFRKGLFDQKPWDSYTEEYAQSEPYKHCVIHELINDELLRSVRNEVKENVSFTPKETDIYKIHQSGDLANLDGLDDEALAKLPSLLALRDAMYSESFRDYVARITGSGPLSGRKTDMAINIYTPGSFLLCHDDVIGSRRVSYILYLTDPDIPWKPEWGGALRLFPVDERKSKDGKVAKTPSPDVSKVIPPAWNQLSFFAVQPGESFHDVEEVYHANTPAQLEKEGGRVRMAISGWFHIPQFGEKGYVEGAEEKNAKNSSLMQLQGNPDQYDRPQPNPVPVENPQSTSSEEFDEADLEFLLQYMSPTYLTPDALEQISDHFEEGSSITLPDLLGKKFAETLKAYVAELDGKSLPEDSAEIEKSGSWQVARPPHKHRYVYMQPGSSESKGKGKGKGKSKQASSPLDQLLQDFLPSPQFRRWLQIATGCVVENQDLIARRFRKGKDYTLATGHEGKPRLELNLGITPTSGWGDDDAEEEDGEGEEGEDEVEKAASSSSSSSSTKANGGKPNGKGKGKAPEQKQQEQPPKPEPEEVGGHEVYMAGDDDDGDDNEDAAIYKGSSGGGGDDENILFFQAACWNKMTIVLRDSGALKFVKYVSRKAPGDRWDVCAAFDVEEREEDDDDEEEEEDQQQQQQQPRGVQDDTEEEWNGFSASEESESD